MPPLPMFCKIRMHPNSAKSQYKFQTRYIVPLQTKIRFQARSRAFCFSSSNETYSIADAWVADKITGGATPASSASFHRLAHKHQRSPGFRPGKLNAGTGVLRSFPLNLVNARNSSLTCAQTICTPTSPAPVLHFPSR